MSALFRQGRALAMCVSFRVLIGGPLYGQEASAAPQIANQAPPEQSQGEPDHAHMNMNMNAGWHFMQDGVVFAEFNHQGGSRGGDEFIAPNWWMGMASRETSRGRLAFTSMFSLDPVMVGKAGYREIFQAGEALNGRR